MHRMPNSICVGTDALLGLELLAEMSVSQLDTLELNLAVLA